MKLEVLLELYAMAETEVQEKELLDEIAREVAIHLTGEMIALGLKAKAEMGIEY